MSVPVSARSLRDRAESLHHKAEQMEAQARALLAQAVLTRKERDKADAQALIAEQGEQKVIEAGGIANSDLLALYHEHGCSMAIFGSHCARCGPHERTEHGWLPVSDDREDDRA